MTAGWDEPTPSAGEDGAAWAISGAFTPWRDVRGATVRTTAEYDQARRERPKVRTFTVPAANVDLARPISSAWPEQQAAWDALVVACLDAIASIRVG
jgi:hypothetical protein